MNAECSIANRHCQPCEGGVPPLNAPQVGELLKSLNGWEAVGVAIEKAFKFANHHETMAFVNAVAWVSHRENHHPELLVGYAECRVRYWTHAIRGLSENDFICAAKLDKLFEL